MNLRQRNKSLTSDGRDSEALKDQMLEAWFLLFRPWSYTATLVPFLIAAGVGIGMKHPDCRWGHWTLGLLSGFLFQATVNLLNTWGDERSGVDDVPGAIRTTPQIHEGSISLQAVLTAALICAAAAALLGVALCFYPDHGTWRFNWPLLGAGIIGFLGSTNYSTGVKFKYHGLGVPFVSFLMGPLEVFVALVLLMPCSNGAILHRILLPQGLILYALATLPIAALVGVIMHGNDMRDIPTDTAAGIVTLASRLGPKGALAYYRICHILPYGITLCLVCVPFLDPTHFPHAFSWLWLPLIVLPLSIRTLRIAGQTFRQRPENPPWRKLERHSGAILLAYGSLYAISLALV